MQMYRTLQIVMLTILRVALLGCRRRRDVTSQSEEALAQLGGTHPPAKIGKTASRRSFLSEIYANVLFLRIFQCKFSYQKCSYKRTLISQSIVSILDQRIRGRL